MSEQEVSQFNFDESFQLGILELMVIDSLFLDKAITSIKPEYFASKYLAKVFTTVRDLKEKYDSKPTYDQLKSEIKKLRPEERVVFQRIVQRIMDPVAKRDHNYIKINLTEFCKKAIFLHMNHYIKNNQNKNPDQVSQKVKEFMEEYNGIDFTGRSCQKIEDLDIYLEQAASDSESLIPTFMPTIDKALNGGVPRGTLTVGISGTNVGKSIWMTNWAYHLIKNGLKVFYVVLEGQEKQTIMRLASRAIGVPFGRVRRGDLNEIEEAKKDAFIKETAGSLQIFHNDSFDFKLEDLIPLIRSKKFEYDFDVLIVDYIQILQSRKKYNDIRHEQAYTHRAINSLCSELNVAGVTVAQGTRGTQEKNQKGSALIRSQDISECYEISRAAATIFTLNRSDKDIEMDTARVLIDKQRDGATGIIEICKTAFNRMAFYGGPEEGLGFGNMDEYMMAKALEEGVARPEGFVLPPVVEKAEIIVPEIEEIEVITPDGDELLEPAEPKGVIVPKR